MDQQVCRSGLGARVPEQLRHDGSISSAPMTFSDLLDPHVKPTLQKRGPGEAVGVAHTGVATFSTLAEVLYRSFDPRLVKVRLR